LKLIWEKITHFFLHTRLIMPLVSSTDIFFSHTKNLHWFFMFWTM